MFNSAVGIYTSLTVMLLRISSLKCLHPVIHLKANSDKPPPSFVPILVFDQQTVLFKNYVLAHACSLHTKQEFLIQGCLNKILLLLNVLVNNKYRYCCLFSADMMIILAFTYDGMHCSLCCWNPSLISFSNLQC